MILASQNKLISFGGNIYIHKKQFIQILECVYEFKIKKTITKQN